MIEKDTTVIGSTVNVDFPELGLKNVPAKVDTGADSSAIWASAIQEEKSGVSFVLFDAISPLYTGKRITVQDYELVQVKNSFGQVELRYKVKLVVKIKGRKIRGNFTLANRSATTFAILIGRHTLQGKFNVDVSKTSLKRDIRILVLCNNKHSPTLLRFFEGIASTQPHMTFVLATYEDIVINTGGVKQTITLSDSGEDIAQFDMVYCKVQDPMKHLAPTIAQYLRVRKVPFADKALINTHSLSKVYQYVSLHDVGVTIPKTIFLASSRMSESYDYFVQELGLPFVLKDAFGNNGRANYLIHSKADFTEALAKHDPALLAQQFIHNDGDYRVLVMGGKVKLIFRRRRTDDESYLNNTSTGGTAELQASSVLPLKVYEQSIIASIKLERDISGVDVVQDTKSGEWYCLEVNDSPQIVSGAFVAEKEAAMAEFINEFVRKLGK